MLFFCFIGCSWFSPLSKGRCHVMAVDLRSGGASRFIGPSSFSSGFSLRPDPRTAELCRSLLFRPDFLFPLIPRPTCKRSTSWAPFCWMAAILDSGLVWETHGNGARGMNFHARLLVGRFRLVAVRFGTEPSPSLESRGTAYGCRLTGANRYSPIWSLPSRQPHTHLTRCLRRFVALLSTWPLILQEFQELRGRI